MKLFDEIKLCVCSGSGGDGLVSFTSARKPCGKPDGGDGGKGGDVYVEAVDDLYALNKYAVGSKTLKAEDGKPGKKGFKKGENGAELILKVPVGSLIYIHKFHKKIELKEKGEKKLLVKGGNGGYGNARFKSSVNRSPQKAIKGQKGICTEIDITLQIIADIGLVGYPNEGKSSLLNVLTGAKAKTGDYTFTTLQPNIGVIKDEYLTKLSRTNGVKEDIHTYDNIVRTNNNNIVKPVIADIPGIIEGASEGKGLGNKFLKHIMRTKAFIFCISANRDTHLEVYRSIKKEINKFAKQNNIDLSDKKELIVITKKDLVSESDINKIHNAFTQINKDIIPISIYDENSLKYLVSEMLSLIQNNNEV